jgi:hypothetical protein
VGSISPAVACGGAAGGQYGAVLSGDLEIGQRLVELRFRGLSRRRLPWLMLLATSREPIGVAGEAAVTPTPLSSVN